MPKQRILATAALLLSAQVGSAEERFRPEASFPSGSLVYLSVGSMERLETGLRSTLFGSIASHRGFLEALGRLPEIVRERCGDPLERFSAATGLDLLQALRLPR